VDDRVTLFFPYKYIFSEETGKTFFQKNYPPVK